MKTTPSTAGLTRLTRRTAALLLAFVISFLALSEFNAIPAEAASAKEWAIIIGTNIGGNTSRVKNNKSIVVDVQYYYPNQIKALKSGGRKVYSYMSIGSLETYRPYYKKFKGHTMGRYKNWGDELWMDVSYKPYQDFIVNELVASVRRKGCDGLWLDNFDVYYEYHQEKIYKGLLEILTRIKKKNIPVYINGGDVFVTRLLNSGKKKLIKGVFQEEVFTQIKGYESNRFGSQTKSDRTYYQNYLKKVKKAGLTAGMLEYTTDPKMRKTIINHAKKNGYVYYISSTTHLR